MPEFKEITAQKILSATGIKEADYVINPYRGCQFGCCFCYAQWNKFAQKKAGRWGDFVDIKVNAIKILEKELKTHLKGTIMLGSTTEVYQPIESKYKLTGEILKLLAKKKRDVIILTRSDLIIRDIDILKSFKNILVCFTLNTVDNDLIRTFEKTSPSADRRIEAIKTLADNKIPVYLHAGPFIPFLTDAEKLLSRLDKFIKRADFENLNQQMLTKSGFNKIFAQKFPHLLKDYEKIYHSKENFDKYWNNVRLCLENLRDKFDLEINIKFHPFESFFQSYLSK